AGRCRPRRGVSRDQPGNLAADGGGGGRDHSAAGAGSDGEREPSEPQLHRAASVRTAGAAAQDGDLLAQGIGSGRGHRGRCRGRAELADSRAPVGSCRPAGRIRRSIVRSRLLESNPMDVSDLITPLNDAQRAAVTAPLGRALVLAGAGSGKTRVLTHRVAWLIRVEHASPFSILAVTFTNKAAAEMRGRIEELIGTGTSGMWIGTFHGLAHRLLRQHWQEAGLPQAFQILDADDQLRVIKRVLRALEIDENRWPPRQVQGFINARKDEGERPEHIDVGHEVYLREMVRIYQAYEQ